MAKLPSYKKEEVELPSPVIISPNIAPEFPATPVVKETTVSELIVNEVVVTPDMYVVALADYEAAADDQMSLQEGTTYIRIKEDYGNGWSYGCTTDGTRTGVFPQTYCEIVPVVCRIQALYSL